MTPRHVGFENVERRRKQRTNYGESNGTWRSKKKSVRTGDKL